MLGGDEAAVLHNMRHVPVVLHAVDHVGGDEQGIALGFLFLKQQLELFDGVGVQADHRLIEDEHLGPMHQPTADGELLLHPLGQLPPQLVLLVGQLEAFQQFVSVAVVLQPVGPADEL